MGSLFPQSGNFIPVPDRRCRVIPEVVIVRRRVFWGLGKSEGGRVGRGLGQGRSVYKQPGTEADGY
jgi:hypothetical protein